MKHQGFKARKMKTMQRRKFLKLATTVPYFGVSCFGGDQVSGVKAEIDDLFEANTPEVLALAKRVMHRCVLDKIRAPKPPLERTWVAPGGPHYLGQWIWDTMFVLDHLSLLSDRDEQIREIFSNYWDFQDRWNTTAPEYAKNMITVAIKTEPQDQREFSQIPILAWGVERVFQRTGDKKLVELCLSRLERFHDWYWRERDLHGNGLITVGAYTGKVQHARWETFDYECNMDELKMTVHPTRRGAKEGAWYGDICVPGNNAYLIMAERSLERLAKIMGDDAMATRRRNMIERGVAGMREHMWDEEAGVFLSVQRDSLEKIPVATIGSWIPLVAEVPSKKMAARMAEEFATPAWQTPLPVPTVERTDSRWKSTAFWRGDVWPPTNYQIATGFSQYGYADHAADICDKTIANAIKHGLSEHYDSMTGKALGVPDYSMSSVVVAMMLDGMSRKHQLKLR